MKYIRYDTINLNHLTITVTAPLDKIIQGCYNNHLDTSIQLWNVTIFSARFHISAQAALASLRSVHEGTHVSRRPFHYQPYCVGSGTHKCFSKAQCQTKAETRSVLLTSWYKAAFVGVMLSRDLRLWVFKHKPSCFIYRNTGTALTVQNTVSCCVCREFFCQFLRSVD